MTALVTPYTYIIITIGWASTYWRERMIIPDGIRCYTQSFTLLGHILLAVAAQVTDLPGPVTTPPVIIATS
jgi:hypothetical protein